MAGRFGGGSTRGGRSAYRAERRSSRAANRIQGRGRHESEKRERARLKAEQRYRNARPSERKRMDESRRNRDEAERRMARDSEVRANERRSRNTDEESSAADAGEEGYNLAMDMCANNGQLSIIEDMGVDAFIDYAESVESGTGGDSLATSCSHPEAVGEILTAAEDAIEAYIIEDEAMQMVEDDAYGEGYDD